MILCDFVRFCADSERLCSVLLGYFVTICMTLSDISRFCVSRVISNDLCAFA